MEEASMSGREGAARKYLGNSRNAKADWHFTADTARVEPKHLYPVL